MILVLNLGLKSIRAIVFDEKGQKLKSVSKPVNTLLRGEYVEQDPEEWWQKAIEVIQEVVLERDIKKSIQYMTVTSSSSCLVPVNSSGSPVYNSIMVSDKRAIDQSTSLEQIPEFIKLRESNGNFIANPSMMIPKIMWLKDNESEVYNLTKYYLSPNDFLIYKLTGQILTDTLNAEKCYYDIEKQTYPVDLLQNLGIQKDGFPEVHHVGFEVGPLSKQVKNIIGFSDNSNIQVILSTYDAMCAFFGSGVIESGEGCVVSGTVSSLRVRADEKPKVLNSDIFIQHEPMHNIYIVGGSNNLGGGLIEWTKQCFYKDEKYPYEIMEKEARESLPGARGIIFLPYLFGERAPLWDVDARGLFFGLERFHTRKDFTRSIFESTGFSILQLMQSIESVNINISKIRFSGGLSRINFIAQLKADILGKEVHVVDEFETTSLGAYIIVALSIGLMHSLEESAKIIKIREVFLPDKEKHKHYSHFYLLYKELYQVLRPLFKKRIQVMNDTYFHKIERIENL